jgi:hypothetical protein
LARGGVPSLDLVAGYVLIATAIGTLVVLTVRARPQIERAMSASPMGVLDA